MSATPRVIRRVRRQVTALLLLAPLAVFFGLQSRPELDPTPVVPVEHFLVVSFASAVGLALALVLAVAAVRLDEWWAFLFALAFPAIAGLFMIHGLATPGVIRPPGSSLEVNLSPHLSLLIGSALPAASSFDRSPRSRRRQQFAQWCFLARSRHADGA